MSVIRTFVPGAVPATTSRRVSVSFVSLSEAGGKVTKADLEAYLKAGGSLLLSINTQAEADLLPVPLMVKKARYVKADVPKETTFSGLCMSDLYYRKVLELPQVTSIDGRSGLRVTITGT